MLRLLAVAVSRGIWEHEYTMVAVNLSQFVADISRASGVMRWMFVSHQDKLVIFELGFDGFVSPG
jgi:hypothetical protein